MAPLGTEERTPPPAVLLVALEPRLYREAIGRAIGSLRPGVRVEVVEPGELEAAVARLGPALVLCNGEVGLAEDRLPHRVVFPDEGPSAAVHLDGGREEVERVELEDLLSIADRAASCARGEGAAR